MTTYAGDLSMIGLLELPEHIILDIASHLEPDLASSIDGPFTRWSDLVHGRAQRAWSEIADLRALSHCHSYLLHLLRPRVYRCPLLKGNRSTSHLCDIFRYHQTLQNRITAVYVDCQDGIPHLYDLFTLPRIHTITIAHFNQPFRPAQKHHVTTSTSVLQVLRLIDCVSLGPALTDLLSWPAHLKEVWYNTDSPVWYWNDKDVITFQQSKYLLEMALASQTDSLERLVVSRHDTKTVLPHPAASNFLDLRRFVELRSLCVDRCEMSEAMPAHSTWERLPPNLEELELAYGNGKDAIQRSRAWQRPNWLVGLLEPEVKSKYAPRLKKIRIMSMLWTSDELQVNSDFDIEGIGAPGSTWRPPRDLMKRFVDADVSFSIFADRARRFRHVAENGGAFEDSWEDAWA